MRQASKPVQRRTPYDLAERLIEDSQSQQQVFRTVAQIPKLCTPERDAQVDRSVVCTGVCVPGQGPTLCVSVLSIVSKAECLDR